MPAVTYNRVATFLEIWEATLEEPASIIFVPSLDNLVEMALFEMRRRFGTNPTGTVDARGTAYLEGLLREIERDIRTDKRNPIIGIMRLKCKAEFTTLQTLLAPTQRRFDLGQLYPVLQIISRAPSPQLLQRELTKELISSRPLNRMRLTALTELLLRQVLLRLGASDLKLLPRKLLSQQFVKLWLPLYLQPLTTDPNIMALVNRVVQDVFLTSAREPDLSQGPEALATEYALWDLLTAIPDYLTDAIRRSLVANPADNDPIGTLIQDDAFVEVFGYKMLQSYLDRFLATFFRAIGWHEKDQRESRFEAFSAAIGDALVATGTLEDNRPTHGHIRPSSPRNLASDALTNPIASMLTRRCLSNYRAQDWRILAMDLSRRVLQGLQTDTAEWGVDWSSSTDAPITRVIHGSIAGRSLQASIEELLRPLRAFCVAQVAILARAPILPLADRERSAFWSEWADSFVEDVSTHYSLFDYLSWPTLSVREFRRFVAALFQELFRPKSEYIVIQRANDIDPEGAIWYTGNMLFYDPTTYNFGEDRSPIAANILTDREADVVGIAVFVDAYSDYDAQQIALQNSKDALHVLAYAFSVSQRSDGFRAELALGVATYNRTKHHWFLRQQNERADQFDVIRARAERVPFYAQQYDRIVALSTLASQSLNALQQSFLESLHWYVRGRWNRDPAERFLFHWIGLEHLFVEGRKKEDLFDLLPRLYRTWLNVGGTGHLQRLHKELVALMQRETHIGDLADRSVALSGWRTDYRIVMAPHKGRVLARIFAGASADARTKLVEHQTELNRLVHLRRRINKAIQFDRDTFTFKLRLLYRWRNEMAHEALPYRPGMEFYAEEVEHILENILIKLANEALQPQPICAFIEDVIALYKNRFL